MPTALSSRVNTGLLVLLVLMAGAIIAVLATRSTAGPLDPTGPPASTLPQVEPRMPIPPVGWSGTFPITINQPGSYFLTRNLNGVASQDGIDITVSDVSLDLNGFSVIGSGAGSFTGVFALAVHRISLSNGKVANWGGGAIDLGGATDSRLTHLIASQNVNSGIVIGANSTLSDCVASLNLYGVEMSGAGSVVSGCDAASNSSYGFYVHGSHAKLADNFAEGNAVGFHIQATNDDVESNSATNNPTFGFDVQTGTGTTLAKNAARANFGGNYAIGGCSFCDIGPITTAASMTSPAGNIDE